MSQRYWARWWDFIIWNSSILERHHAFTRCSRRGHSSALSTSRANLLLRFFSTQRHLEFTYLSRLSDTQTTTRVRAQDVLHIVHTLSTTVPLLLHPQLGDTSLRRLEYISGGQSSREEVRAIEKIYHLGPQLRSLRFAWGAGRTWTFLDVTRFFCIAMNTSSIKHIYLSDTSRNVGDFPQACLISTTYKEGLTLDIRAVCYNGPQIQDLEAANSCVGPKHITRKWPRRT